jgi:hypothetical protein
MDMIKRGLELLFRRRDFGRLMGVQFASQMGDGLVQGALAAVIAFGGQKGFDLESARSPDEILRIALYIFIPYTILSPFLGVVIDRWDRRKLMVFVNALRFAVLLSVGLAGVDAIGDVPLFLAFLLTLTGTRIVLATKAAATPETLDGDRLVEGNAVSQLGGALFQLAGAAFAVVGKAVIEPELIVILGALVYGIATLFAWTLRRVGEARPATTFAREVARVVGNIVAGLREVAATPKAGASITTYFWLRFLWSFSIAAAGLIARALLGNDELTLAALIGGAGAVGAVLGFVTANVLLARMRTTAHLVLAAAGVGGLGVAVFGAFERGATLAALTFCLGFGFFLAKISLDTMVQEALGDDFRGRAFSLYDIAYNVAWVLAAGILKLSGTGGVEGVLLAAIGVVFLVGMAALGAWYRRAGLLTMTSPEAAPARS